MSDNHDDSGKIGAFIYGMLLGMLIAGSASGAFFVSQIRHQTWIAEQARKDVDAARDEAKAARQMVEEAEAARQMVERTRSEAAARKAKE
jgi:uncharacterized protein (DUF3084 family)